MLAIAGCGQDTRPPDRIEHYPAGDGQMELHVFQTVSAAPHPTVLFFHGGAWQRGGPSQFYPQCRELSAAGYLCVSAAYRVATRDGTSPSDAADDAQAALARVYELADELGADPDRIVLSGGSAGGHLAALLATGQAGRYPPREVAALVLFNPMLNLEPGRPDHQFVGEDWEILSPHHQIHSRLPPTLILLGDRDSEVPVPTAEAFCQRMKEFDGVCELDIASGQEHGFFNRSHSRWHFYRTLYEMRGFLDDQGVAP